MAHSQKSWVNTIAIGTTISTTLAGMVVGGFLLGRYLDRLWSTEPWMQIICILVGLFSGGAYLITTLKRLIKMQDNGDKS